MPLENATAPAALVIVTGAGRTGTSTMAGTLKMLGAAIPQPEVPPSAANPRGHFEPRWVVDFHRRLLKEAGARILDARPTAEDLTATTASRPEHRAELRHWLAEHLHAPLTVVKDPRTLWFRQLWVEVAADLGASTAFVTMVRHPAEVIGSWDMHYLKNAEPAERLARETANLAGWVNVSLTNERASRAGRRAFVPYANLIGDWRATMIELSRRLDISYDADLGSGEPHEVDQFIDVDLRRSRLTWDDLDVPAALREIAETVHRNLIALAADPDDPLAIESNDEMRREYDRLHQHADALVRHATAAEIMVARKEERRAARRELRRSAPPPSLARRALRRLRSSGRRARP